MKGQLDLHKQVSFVWDETHTVDTARCALDELYFLRRSTNQPFATQTNVSNSV